MKIFLILLTTYLIGGIPFSFLVAKALKNVDLRTVGSGNVGATNACRLFPKPLSFVVFLGCFTLDAMKGFLTAYYFSPMLQGTALTDLSHPERAIVVGLAAILGHIYTPYLRFKGGKGVATSLGAFMAAAPMAVLITAVAGIAIILISRFVSLGSVAMAIILPVCVAIFQPDEGVLLAVAIIIGLFIVFKHRTNIQRLMQGKEARLFSKQFDLSQDPSAESQQ